jgi:hypothetical protein
MYSKKFDFLIKFFHMPSKKVIDEHDSTAPLTELIILSLPLISALRSSQTNKYSR